MSGVVRPDGKRQKQCGDTAPFDHPLFDGLGPALSRVGVVDVGSNSIRMVVFDGAARHRPISTTKRSWRAGAGLATTGMLNPEGAALAGGTEALCRLAEGMGIKP